MSLIWAVLIFLLNGRVLYRLLEINTVLSNKNYYRSGV